MKHFVGILLQVIGDTSLDEEEFFEDVSHEDSFGDESGRNSTEDHENLHDASDLGEIRRNAVCLLFVVNLKLVKSHVQFEDVGIVHISQCSILLRSAYLECLNGTVHPKVLLLEDGGLHVDVDI